MYKEFVNIVFLVLVACVNEMYTFTTSSRVVKVYSESGNFFANEMYTFTTTSSLYKPQAILTIWFKLNTVLIK
jgi:hypothetical protein